MRKIIRTLLQSRSVVSPDSVRNGECSPSPSGAVSRDLGGSSRDLGGSSREVGASSSLEGSDLKSFSSSSDARSRERWRSMARRGSFAEGNHQDILGRSSYSIHDNLLSGQNGSGAKRKSERKGSSSAGEIHTFSSLAFKCIKSGIRKIHTFQRMKASRRENHIYCVQFSKLILGFCFFKAFIFCAKTLTQYATPNRFLGEIEKFKFLFSQHEGSSRPPRCNYWRLPGVQEDE